MTSPVRKLMTGLALIGLLSFATTSIVLAGTQGAPCSLDPTYVRFWENPIGDTSDNNDSVYYCSNLSDARTISHTLPGNCHTWVWLGSDWNDCVDSYTVWTPPGTWSCVYQDYNYVGFFDSRAGNNNRNDLVYGDVMSSMKFGGNNGFC